MDRDVKSTREEILRRRDALIDERYRRKMRVLGGSFFVLAIAMVGVLAGLANRMSPGTVEAVQYGTLMFSPQLGAYVLIGVVCFVGGMLLAVHFLKKSKKKSKTN